jgi:acyl-CoA reductase-like NAD-dependent aldehyde dehydrogenase
MYEKFVEKAAKKAESLKIGNPLDPSTGIKFLYF